MKENFINEINEYADNLNNGELNWDNVNQLKWYFYYDYKDKEFKTSSCITMRRPGCPHFLHRNFAEQAVHRFKEELLQYYLGN